MGLEILLHSNLTKARKQSLFKRLRNYFFDRSRLKNYPAMQNDIYCLKHKYSVIEIVTSLIKVATKSKNVCITSQVLQAIKDLFSDLNFWKRNEKKLNENNAIQNISLANTYNFLNIEFNPNFKKKNT